jgi:integrase
MMSAGIEVRHQRSCRSHEGGRCNCRRGYRVRVWDPREQRLHVQTFADPVAAKTWRDDTSQRVRAGTMRVDSSTTIAQAAEALIAGMNDGTVLDRTGRPYKPSTRRGYARDLRNDVVPTLGGLRLTDVRRRDIQALVDALRARYSPSSVHNKLDPLRVIFRRALRDDVIAHDPTVGLEMPSVRGRRDKIASPTQAAALIAALPDPERALWCAALYGGLRIGELRALRWSDVDLPANLIRIRSGWDEVEGAIDPKSRAGTRPVPLAGEVRRALLAHKLATGRDGEDLVFGRTATEPFVRTTVRSRALRAWGWRQVRNPQSGGKKTTWTKSRDDALDPLTPHEARHCAVSYMIAAGMNPKQISVYIGHGDVRQTWNRYGHLMPGDEHTAVAQLDAFLTPPVDKPWTQTASRIRRPATSPSGPSPAKSG